MRITLPIDFHLIRDQECANKVPDLAGGEVPEIDSTAMTTLLESDHLMICCVVFPKITDIDPFVVTHTLVHESSHVFDFISKYLDIEQIDGELRAYSIESIFAQLYNSYSILVREAGNA